VPTPPRRLNGSIDYGQRIAAVETSVSSHTASLVEIHKTLESLATQLHDIRQTRWSSIWPAIGVAITLAGTAGALFIAPISRDVAALQHEAQLRDDQQAKLIEDLRGRVRANEQAIPRVMREMLHDNDQIRDKQLEEKLRQVEAKQAWLNDVTNMQHRSDQRVIGLIWQKITGESLPGIPDTGAGPGGDP